MEASDLLLIAALGAITVLLMLCGYILAFDRKRFLMLWFTGWSIIASNYFLDALFSDLLRQNQLIFYLSLCSFFCANLLISWGTLLFLKTKIKTSMVLGIGVIWLILFAVFAMLNWPDLRMIQYMYLTVFTFFFLVGVVMLRLVKYYGRLILILGLLNIAWVINNLVFSYILKMPLMAPYIVSHIILILNAIGLIQLYFKEQKDAIQEGLDYITHLTFHDGLTGLYNKTYFDNKLDEMENKKECLPISLIVADMDGLKFINDVYGHLEGDLRLKKMAHLIQQACRPNDIIARWGGDEFTVILPNTDKETANTVRDKIYRACKNVEGTDLLLSLSLGVATKTDKDGDLSMVLKEAEELMYQTKLIEGRKIRRAIANIMDKVLKENDNVMKEHTERLQSLAKEFAKTLNLSDEKRENLLQAVSLLDIGSIGISKDFIQKKTVLHDEEEYIMKKHVEIGYRIARTSDEHTHLADIILYHHEWWNGQGYPQGLKGEEIPLISRVISIIDAYDLMTTPQMNKPAMTTERALLELESKAGSQFDPSLVQHFVQMMNTK